MAFFPEAVTNPDYGATALLYLTLASGGRWSILALIPTILTIRCVVISEEERYLERKFGEQYGAYKFRVRLRIGWVGKVSQFEVLLPTHFGPGGGRLGRRIC
jgi:protein-S-isoprenylcysteine O-methyltransferase Ste14